MIILYLFHLNNNDARFVVNRGIAASVTRFVAENPQNDFWRSSCVQLDDKGPRRNRSGSRRLPWNEWCDTR